MSLKQSLYGYILHKYVIYNLRLKKPNHIYNFLFPYLVFTRLKGAYVAPLFVMSLIHLKKSLRCLLMENIFEMSILCM